MITERVVEPTSSMSVTCHPKIQPIHGWQERSLVARHLREQLLDLLEQVAPISSCVCVEDLSTSAATFQRNICWRDIAHNNPHPFVHVGPGRGNIEQEYCENLSYTTGEIRTKYRFTPREGQDVVT